MSTFRFTNETKFKCAALLLFLLFSLSSWAGSVKYEGTRIDNFGRSLETFSTASDQYTAYQILNSDSMVQSDVDVLNLGVSKLTHWVRFKVENTTDERIVLNFPFPVIDVFDAYLFNDEGVLVDSLKSGVSRPFSNRAYDHQDFVIPISQAAKTCTVVIRLSNGSQIILPSTLSNDAELNSIFYKKDLLMGTFIGVILIMFFYNLFIYLSTRDTNYRFYLIYLATIAFAQFTINGYTYKYLTDESPFWSTSSIYIGGICSGLGVLFFVIQFLHLKTKMPTLRKIIYGYIWLYVLAIVFLLMGENQLTYNTINFGASTGSLVVLVGSIMVARNGYRPAWFFTIAWSIFLLTVILYVLKDINVLPYNNLTVYSMPFGAAIEVTLLGLALADKINILEEETRMAREREVIALKENEILIKEQNVVLERKVEERTSDLQEALETLKGAQAQLVSQEKMASLGQLTAGIAHEINNPINFVSSNVTPLRRDINDLVDIISEYDKLTESEEYSAIHNKVQKMKEEGEYDYVLTEINQLLNGIQDGAERTSEIVKSLKNFSRLDELESKFADIHEGIESTLVILKSGTKKEVNFITNYDDSILPIECYPGKLNQVFSNLIVNAIQAMTTEPNVTANPEIRISTKDLGDKVQIVISDNGPGIPQEIQSKIFEPFFTTKEVGEGTGLGLSIVFSIIESHNGIIEVNSKEGEGTEFSITIAKTLH